MQEQIQVFNNPEFGNVRTMEIDGEPWFVGKDIAVALGYSNPQKAIRDHVDDDERTVNESFTVNGTSPILISEPGIYGLVLGSKLDSAKRFKHWIKHDVIPSIRKTGGYHLPQTYPEALRELAATVEAKEKLEAQNQILLVDNERMKPKEEFFDTVTDSKDAIPFADVAKVLDMNIGRNKLFAFLRDKGVLQRDNRPYQKYIDAGYFRVIEEKFDKGFGDTSIYIKTLVFQKGVDYIRKRLLEAGYKPNPKERKQL